MDTLKTFTFITERLRKALSKLNDNYSSRWQCSVIFSSLEEWVLSSSNPPIENAEQRGSSDYLFSVSLVDKESIDTFLHGDAHPQVEVLNGKWKVSGNSEAIAHFSEAYFEYSEYMKSEKSKGMQL